MVVEIVLDFETLSRVNIKKAGARRYAEDPSTDVICLSYAIGNAEPKTWAPHMGRDIPRDLAIAIANGFRMVAHAALFEQSIWELVMVARYGWPAVPAEQWDDNQAMAEQ